MKPSDQFTEYDLERMSLNEAEPYDQDDEICDLHEWLEFRACLSCGTFEKLERI